jgi:putative DNA primase/helicase
MASRLDAAILSIGHFSKSNGANTGKALHKFIGSIAFVAGPRVAFAIIEDAEDSARRLFLHAKNNIAPPAPGLAFRIEQALLPGRGISASRIAWEVEPVSITADEAIAAGKTKRKAPTLEEAKQFLAGREGMGVKDIEDEAKEVGISLATLRRAKEELEFKSVKEGFDRWVWKR